MVEIYLENITHIYEGRTLALNNISLRIPNGSFTALLGPSGCGKTTTLRIIAGLIRPTKGKVYFDGDDVTYLTPQERNVAMVFQFIVVYDMSVYKNIAFPLKVRGLPQKEIDLRVKRIAEKLGLTQYLDLPAHKLDAGTRQKVALARALVREPNVFLLDEPLTNVDPKSRLEIRAILKEIQRDLKQTMIYVTHDQAEALTLAEKIAVMNKGRILQYDTPQRLYEYPANTFVAWFIGNPGMNLINAVLVEKNDRIWLDFKLFKIDISEYRDIIKGKGEKFIVGIRPEYIRVLKTPQDNYIKGRCYLVERLSGKMRLLHVEIGEIDLKIKTPLNVKEGEYVWLNLPKEKIRIFDEKGDLLI